MRLYKQLIIITLVSLFLSACSSSSSRYSMRHDAAPLRAPTELEMQDAIVTKVIKSASTTRPYEVLGKRYTPMLDETGYSETGIASWYGRKFHGYHTSNGEVYDMFDMTAAHNTLPLPSFAITLADTRARKTYVQVAAGSTLANIEALAHTLREQYKLPTNIVEKDAIYRLHLGPIKDAQHAQQVLETLKQNQFQNAFLLYTQ